MNSDCNDLKNIHFRKVLSDVELRLLGPKMVCGITSETSLLAYGLRLQVYNRSKHDVAVVGPMIGDAFLGFRNRRYWEMGNEDEWAFVPDGPMDITQLSQGREVLSPGQSLEMMGDVSYMAFLHTSMLSGESVHRKSVVGQGIPRVFGLEFEYALNLLVDGVEEVVSGRFRTQMILVPEGRS